MYRHRILPLVALLAGGGGCYLNHMVHSQAVNSETELLIPSSPYPTVLLLLTAIMAVVFLLGVLKGTTPKTAQGCLQAGRKAIHFLPGCALAFFMGAGSAVTSYAQQMKLRGEGLVTPFPMLFVVIGMISLVAAIALLVVNKYQMKGEFPPMFGTLFTLVAFVPLPWLLLCYQSNTGNPVISLYGYQLMALSAATVALYFVASFFYGACHVKTATVFSLMGGYLLITSMELGQSYQYWIAHIALSTLLLYLAAVMLKNTDFPTLNQQEGTD